MQRTSKAQHATNARLPDPLRAFLSQPLVCVFCKSNVCPRLHYRLLTLCPAPTDPVGQSWPRGTG
jgi:hypothetical protein